LILEINSSGVETKVADVRDDTTSSCSGTKGKLIPLILDTSISVETLRFPCTSVPAEPPILHNPPPTTWKPAPAGSRSETPTPSIFTSFAVIARSDPNILEIPPIARVDTKSAAVSVETSRSGETLPGTYSWPLMLDTNSSGVDTKVAAVSVETSRSGATPPGTYS